MLTVLVPTRGRPHRVQELITAVASTKTLPDTEIWFGVDQDDLTFGDYRDAIHVLGQEGVMMCLRPGNGGMVQGLNEMVKLRTVLGGTLPTAWMFMGDDHRPRTIGWDEQLLNAATGRLDGSGPGIAYANDLLQGANLPTQVCIDARIVELLGNMAPPQLTHLYVDNYWKKLGEGAGCLRYCSGVTIEHMHPVAGKATMDEGYARVNAGEMYARDEAAFGELQRNDVLASEIRAVIELRERVMA